MTPAAALSVIPLSRLNAVVIQETGEQGPLCFEQCAHDLCTVRHQIARSYCRLCHCSIGYYSRFHRDQPRDEGYVHSACLALVVDDANQLQVTLNPLPMAA